MSETRSVETSAPDIEEAIELGLGKLGVTRESVIVEILEEPSRGLLGIGARPARVRLTTAARPATPTPPPPPPQRAERPGGYDVDEEDDDHVPLLSQAIRIPESELDDDAQVGLATVKELLGRMHIKAQVDVYRASEESSEGAPWVLQIHGRDLGTLIGRRGETLGALQYITRLIVSRELQRRANIVLDVEGYKTRREQMLRKLAVRMADQAVQMGRTVPLEPMPPYERRIVHLALRDRQDVTTQSVGEGEHRKVTIVPTRR